MKTVSNVFLKYVRENQMPLFIKDLAKAAMERTRLRNNLLQSKT